MVGSRNRYNGCKIYELYVKVLGSFKNHNSSDVIFKLSKSLDIYVSLSTYNTGSLFIAPKEKKSREELDKDSRQTKRSSIEQYSLHDIGAF